MNIQNDCSNMFKIHAFSSISVSVIMENFNKAHYLKRSIGTLKNQTNQILQLIAVDDCSSDNSSEFITNMIKTDSRIKLIQHIYNEGTTAAKNHAILSSNGHYIMQLDPGDEFVSTSIENAYKAASFVDADILEYELSVKFLGNIMNLPNYTIPTCKTNNSNGNEPLLTKFQ